jgi:hypothetical protein
MAVFTKFNRSRKIFCEYAPWYNKIGIVLVLYQTTGDYIAWWSYTIYKSKGLELFLHCTFVY